MNSKTLKYFCASLLILLSGAAFAQNDCLTLDVDFSIDVSADSQMTGKALLEVQGNAFKMNGNGIAAYCDGASVWTLDLEAKEAYIESVSPETEEYMQNLRTKIQALSPGSETSFLSPEGQKVAIKVNSIKKSAGKDVSTFRPAQNFDSSWVVTDLR